MTVTIPAVPETLVISPFPELGSSNYNLEAYNNGITVPPAISRLREIAVVTRELAVIAQNAAEAAASAQGSIGPIKDQALADIETARVAAVASVDSTAQAVRDEALGYSLAAEASADQAAASAAAAVGALNYKGQWSSLSGPLSIPATVTHNLQLWALATSVPDVASAEPGVSPVWYIVRESAPIGTLYTGLEKPQEGTWLEMGTAYLQASYPELFSKLGKLNPGEFTFTGGTFPFADTTYSAEVFEAGTNLFAVGWKSGVAALFAYSSNAGTSWTPVTVANLSGFTRIGVVSVGTTAVLTAVAVGASMYRTTDSGLTWSVVTPPATSAVRVFRLGSDFALSSGTNLWKSSTGLTGSWTSYPCTLDGAAVQASIGASAIYSEYHGLYVSSYLGNLITSPDCVTWVTRRSLISEGYGGGGSSVPFVAGKSVGLACQIISSNSAVVAYHTQDFSSWVRTKSTLAGFSDSGPSSLQVVDLEGFTGVFSRGGTAMAAFILDSSGAIQPVIGIPIVANSSNLEYPIKNLRGKVWIAGIGAAYKVANLYPYNDSTQFVTPPADSPFGLRQWIKGAA